MKVRAESHEGGLRLILLPEGRDSLVTASGVRFVRREAHFRTAVPLDAEGVHPDLVALAGLLLTSTWARGPLTLDRPISPEFAAAVQVGLRRAVRPVDAGLAPRSTDAGAVPALCFSGGADSTAALEVMPRASVAVHLRRTTPPELEHWPGYCRRADLFDGTAALRATEAVARSGRRSVVVDSDLEYLRHPVGFPSDLAAAAPAVLLADVLGFDAVGWGTVLESAYLVGRGPFTDYASRPELTGWNTVFTAAGLPFLNAVAGASEVVTTRIAAASPWADTVQSCARAKDGVPCMNCWKCFRKGLTEGAATGAWPEDAELDRLFAALRVRKYLSGRPIKHEGVLTHILGSSPLAHPLLAQLASRVGVGELDADHLARVYIPSLLLLPDRYRDEVAGLLKQHVAPMSEQDVGALQAWDLLAWEQRPEVRRRSADLVASMTHHAEGWNEQRRLERAARAAEREERRQAARLAAKRTTPRQGRTSSATVPEASSVASGRGSPLWRQARRHPGVHRALVRVSRWRRRT